MSLHEILEVLLYLFTIILLIVMIAERTPLVRNEKFKEKEKQLKLIQKELKRFEELYNQTKELYERMPMIHIGRTETEKVYVCSLKRDLSFFALGVLLGSLLQTLYIIFKI